MAVVVIMVVLLVGMVMVMVAVMISSLFYISSRNTSSHDITVWWPQCSSWTWS